MQWNGVADTHTHKHALTLSLFAHLQQVREDTTGGGGVCVGMIRPCSCLPVGQTLAQADVPVKKDGMLCFGEPTHVDKMEPACLSSFFPFSLPFGSSSDGGKEIQAGRQAGLAWLAGLISWLSVPCVSPRFDAAATRATFSGGRAGRPRSVKNHCAEMVATPNNLRGWLKEKRGFGVSSR